MNKMSDEEKNTPIIEKIRDDIAEIRVILGRQEESLKLHIYRTTLAEKNLDLLRQEFHMHEDKLDKELKPINKHINLVDSAFKILGVLSILVSIVGGLLKIFRIL